LVQRELEKKKELLSKRLLRVSAISLGLVGLLLTLLFASISSLQSPARFDWRVFDSASSNSSNVTAYGVEGWNVTEIGTTGTYVDAKHGQEFFKGVIFNNNLVFWRVINSTNFAVTTLSLSDYTFKDVFNFTSPVGAVLSKCFPTDMEIVDDTVFAVYGYAAFPNYNTTIIKSSDLSTWTQYCVSNTVFAESIEQYTGPGFLNGILEYGGYRSDGRGTYAVINAWNSTSGSEIFLFSGTISGSDDVCYMKMFNSTCMIAGDAFPYNVLYTNDGQNWTDQHETKSYTLQYLFDWGWNIEIRDGSAYITAEPYDLDIAHGGLVKWNNAPTPFDYGMTIESIANGLIGGCEGLYNIGLDDFPGVASVYQYNLDGTIGSLIWKSTYTGSVSNLTYDPSGAAWYGLVLRRTNPQSVTVIMIQ
jgi:hypothetical protein